MSDDTAARGPRINQTYQYLAEKLGEARRRLMLPMPEGGETEGIVHAFTECSLAFHHTQVDELDEPGRGWAKKIQAIMDDSSFDPTAGDATWYLKASSMSVDNKLDLRTAVDGLATWARLKFYRIE